MKQSVTKCFTLPLSFSPGLRYDGIRKTSIFSLIRQEVFL